MPRPLSDSWQYFELLSPDNSRNRKAKCNFCGHKQAAGITRLHQHLLYRCSRISPDLRDQLRQKHEDQGRESPPKGNQVLSHHLPQSSLDYQYDSTLQNTLQNSNSNVSTNNQQQSPSHINPHPTYFEAATALSPTTTTNFSTAFPTTTNSFGQQQQAMLDCQLARALFSANIPFESIENPNFIDFLKRLQPNYTVPKKRRLQQFLLKEQHWDLIPWDNEANLLLPRANQQQLPPSPLMQHQHQNPQQQQQQHQQQQHQQQHQQQQQQQHQQQQQQHQQQRRMLPNNNPNAMNNRLLSSIHPPADLEGSL